MCTCSNCSFIVQVASLASLAQLLPSRSPTWVIRCRIALCAELLLPARLHRSVSTACCWAPGLHLLQVLLAACVRFSCCSRLRPLQLCSPMASASSAAPRLRPLQLLLPNCVRFGCCSPPAVLEDSGHVRYVHYSRTFYIRGVRGLSMKVARHYSLVPPHEHLTSVTHRHTVKILIYWYTVHDNINWTYVSFVFVIQSLFSTRFPQINFTP